MKASFEVLSSMSFALAIALLISITTAAPEAVLDISGHKLKTGLTYNILPLIRGSGGGLTTESTKNNNTCPLYVVQEKLEILNGTPVTFTPYKANKHGVIFTSTDLNIKSYVTRTTTCSESPVWRLLKVLSGVWFLSTGGVEGNPSSQTIANWFMIEKAEKDYVLSFCPTKVCNCQVLCRALGMYIGDDGRKHLALSDQVPPFRVMFKRA